MPKKGLIGAGAVSLFNALLLTVQARFTLGVLFLYLLAALLLGWGAWYAPLKKLCEKGPFRWLKYAFFGGAGSVLALMLFLFFAGRPTATGGERAIIVPGAAVRGEEVSATLERRLEAAYALWAENPGALLVVSGGQGPGAGAPEGVIMARWLRAKGVPAQQILTEDRATSTEENFRFAAKLLEEAGVSPHEPVVYVTNRFHCYRCGLWAQEAGFTQAAAQPASLPLEMILPCYLREGAAVAYYWAFHSLFSL